jgi:hypothetical protein
MADGGGEFRQNQIGKAQIDELWRATFGEPPPISTETDMMLQVLIRCLQPPPWRPGP